MAATLDAMSLNPTSASPRHTARLAAATGVPLNRRVLAYHEAPPAATDTTLAQQREFARPLYARPGSLPSSKGAVTNKSRKIATQPERVLDAPGMVDDFYLNLLSWSSLNTVAVALGENVYMWKADTGAVVHIGEAIEGTYVSSVDFSKDGTFLGVGNGTGEVDLWDIEAGQKLRTMGGHQNQIATLSWNGHVLSSGCGDGSIWHHDVRIARHKVMELVGHVGEVCGLKWRADGELLASGGNDNVVNIWDGRLGDVVEGSRGVAKWTKRNHTAAVKVGPRPQPLASWLTTCVTGHRVVSLAAFSSRQWRRHQRRHRQHLEQHHRRALALAQDTVPGDVGAVVAAQKGVSDDARVPDQLDHGARVPFARTRGGDSRCARFARAVQRHQPRGRHGLHGRRRREPQVLAHLGCTGHQEEEGRQGGAWRPHWIRDPVAQVKGELCAATVYLSAMFSRYVQSSCLLYRYTGLLIRSSPCAHTFAILSSDKLDHDS